jgi:hypothetical protein
MIILRLSYPITQLLVMEILMHWTYQREFSDPLHSGTPQKRSNELQAQMNDPGSKIRVLAASMQCGGVGLNFQHDSHVCMLFEAASTLAQTLARRRSQTFVYTMASTRNGSPIPWTRWLPSGN